MFLNVIKGPYPGLAQNDRTLPIAADATGIERGSFLKVNEDAEYEVAMAADAGSGTTPGAFLYMALQDQSDLVAGMAGNVGQGAVSASSGQPVINALSIIPSMQVQTDMFDPDENWAIGDWCAVGDNGKLVEHATGETAVGKVDGVPAARWVNNATAVTGWRTGAPVSCITITTVYIPNLATADAT